MKNKKNNSSVQVFTEIKELVTCVGAHKKSGRKIIEADLTIVKNAAIIESDKKILWVGEKSKLKSALTHLNLKGKQKSISLAADCVIPAFIDCHTHTVFAGDRKSEFEMRNQGVSYQEIAAKGGGIQYTVAQTKAATDQGLLKLAEARAQSFLRQGVTTVEIKSGYGLTEKDEIKILKVINKIKSVRVVPTYLGAHAIPKGRTADDYLNEIIQKTLPLIKKMKLSERVDIFIEKGYFNVEQAQKYCSAARETGFNVTAHVDQMSRSQACIMLTEFSAHSLDHLVFCENDDIQQLAKSETTCVLLPTSDFYLKMKYPPARALIDAGARVALASDYNPGTAPSQDFSFLGVLARLEMKMTLPEVLAALTVGGAHALGLQTQLGSLEASKFCDFAVLEGSWRDLFYSVGHHPITKVYREGMWAWGLGKS